MSDHLTRRELLEVGAAALGVAVKTRSNASVSQSRMKSVGPRV